MPRQVISSTSPPDPDSPIPGEAGEPDPGRTFPLSLYASLTSTTPERYDLTWANLGEMIGNMFPTPCTLADCRRSECPHKANGKLWSPVLLRPGATRKNANVESVSLLVLDHDHLSGDWRAGFVGLEGYRTLIYPTHSDRDGDRCLRTINACSRPVTAEEWPRFWIAAVKLLGVPVDIHCRDVSRAYYQPTRPRDAEYQLEVYDGVALDVDAILATAPVDEPIAYTPRAPKENALLPPDDRIAAAARVLGEAWPSTGRHVAHLALSGALARAGWNVNAIAEFCAAVAEVQQPGNADLDKRFKTAQSTADKLASGANVTGLPTLTEHVAPEAVREACRLLGILVPEPDPEFAAEMTSAAKNSPSTDDDEAAPDAVLSPLDAVAYLNHRAAWIESIGRIAVPTKGDGIEYQRVETFKITHDNRRVKISGTGEKDRFAGLGSFWLASPDRRSYERVGLYPPPAVAPPRTLNLWTGFGVAEHKGAWSLMRAHIRDVIADGDATLDNYIVRWIAWMLRNPGSRAEAAIALRGDEGIGKGMLGNTLCTLLGRHAVHVTNPEHFASGRFNAHMDRAVFLFADECHWPGHKKHEGTLKGMITEPTLRIEPKGVDSYEVPNRLHVMISSNDKWVVPASIGARRFVVADVSCKHKGDHAYFGTLVHELDNGGREAMLHDLLAMDLGDWHPRQIVDTQALRDQKERSLSPEDEWFLGVLDDGVLPGPSITGVVGVAYTAELEAHARATVPELRNRGARKLIAVYKQVGAEPWRGSDRHTRTRGWQFPPLAEARLAWERRHFPRNWPECDRWTVDGRSWTR